MKILFCWSTLSGYMASCWRRLSMEKDIDLFVLCTESNKASNTGFNKSILNNINSRVISAAELNDYSSIRKLILKEQPDILFIGGWATRSYRRLVFDKDLRNIRKFLCIDTPRRNNLRQFFARIILAKYLVNFDAIWTTGTRAHDYARYLRFSDDRIFNGLYAVDTDHYNPLWNIRADSWPKAFLFIGQYIKRKGFDLLLKAYDKYSNNNNEPWPLITCGSGPLEYLIPSSRVFNKGFIQPGQLSNIFLSSGVLVLPSIDDNWPLVISEACASGLPIVCTNKCGSADDLIKNGINGIVIKSNSSESMADALFYIHKNADRLPTMGKESMKMVDNYSINKWIMTLKIIISQ